MACGVRRTAYGVIVRGAASCVVVRGAAVFGEWYATIGLIWIGTAFECVRAEETSAASPG